MTPHDPKQGWKRHKRFAIIGGILAVCCSVWGRTPPTPELTGVRAAGMGDAYTAIADGADGHFHNPAGLGVGQGVHLFGQTNPNRRSEFRLDPKGISYRWRGTGLAWGNRIRLEPDDIADYTYLSVGRQVSPFVSLGVSGKFYRVHPSEHFQVFGRLPTYDFGVLAAPRPDWRFGLRASTLKHRDRVQALTFGTAFPVASMLLSLESEWREGEAVRVRLGAERMFFGSVALRAGWREEAPAVGVGIRLPHTRLNAAWTMREGMNLLFLGAELAVSSQPSATENERFSITLYPADGYKGAKSESQRESVLHGVGSSSCFHRLFRRTMVSGESRRRGRFLGAARRRFQRHHL